MQDVLSACSEPRCAVWHHAFALGSTDLATEVGLSGLAELALLAFRSAANE